MIDDLISPNGLALSPNESILYVVDSISQKVWKYEILKMPKLRENRDKNKSKNNVGNARSTHNPNHHSTKKPRKRKTQSLNELLNDLDDEDDDDDDLNDNKKNIANNDNVNDNANDNVDDDALDASDAAASSDAVAAAGVDGKEDKQSSVLRKPILSEGVLFYDFKSLVQECTQRIGHYNGPDGVKVDTVGNLYVAGACGVHVIGTDGKLTASLLLNKVRLFIVIINGTLCTRDNSVYSLPWYILKD